ncbi:hypothetical protein [Paenibacillus senegalimassiliensis]|uniref:hypothetical protein n=1 Tax=Paenibacillus senegalimassiliensis TaxID=1737426 RepID=UPI00073EFBB3|nr:hypothetical protein [Paenibacillus senegalimassiliensis]
MTPWELERMIAAKQRQHKAQLRTQAVIAYQQAGVTAALMSRVWGNKQKAPDLKTAFPGIFEEEVPAPSEPGNKPYKQQDYRIMKARLEQYAAARKKWGEKKRGNHHRGASDSDNSQNGRVTEGPGFR